VRALENYLDDLLAGGRAWFSRDEGLAALGLGREAFSAAAARLVRKQRLVSPRRGFFLILRPEDRVAGAPEPARWIDPLMRYLRLDYRVSLLRAAAFHGSSHQAAMVFQVVVPRQLRGIEIGRQRLQFLYQAPAIFARTNHPDWLVQMKSESGFAKAAGVELVLLDCARYFHQAAGIDGVAQVVTDLGSRVDPRRLVKAGACYENATVRRLGYLLERAGHLRQARALEPFAAKAKSTKPLDPSVEPLHESLAGRAETDAKWKLLINVPVETDS
jgi:hypothetical protein